MLVFVAQVSRVYPLETSVIMSYTSRHVLSASVNKQNKTKQINQNYSKSFLTQGIILSQFCFVLFCLFTLALNTCLLV